MRMHFDDLRMVEHLLVAGKLDDGRSLAYLLTRPTADAGLASWDEQSRRVTAAAGELTRAPDVNEALRQLARVAVECAGCHIAAGRTPTFASPPLPVDQPTPEARMARHAWAAERLWEAILGGDDARWRSGLVVLADAPLPAVLSHGSRFGRGLQAYARTELDTRGSSLEARGTAYGEILVLCAGCHATRY
jgi:cytochrome c553